jgi:hypothetical protein
MFQVIATTTRKRNTTQNWDLRIKNDRLEFSQTFFGLNNMQNNELTFGKSIDTYLLMVSSEGQFYKKTARGENKSKTFSNITLITYLTPLGTSFKLEVFEKNENATFFKFTPIVPEDDEEAQVEVESPEVEPHTEGPIAQENQYQVNF